MQRIVTLTDDEIVILHHLMITEVGKAEAETLLPECTGNSDCTACNLMGKMYILWKQVQDGNLS